MSKRATFIEADVRRAIRAALKAGLPLGHFEVSVSGDGVKVTTFAEAREAPSREEPNSWDELHDERETRHQRKTAEASAADHLISAIRERVSPAAIATAYNGKRSLSEIEAAKLLGVRVQDLDVLGRGGRLKAVRRRYPEAAILTLIEATDRGRR